MHVPMKAKKHSITSDTEGFQNSVRLEVKIRSKLGAGPTAVPISAAQKGILSSGSSRPMLGPIQSHNQKYRGCFPGVQRLDREANHVVQTLRMSAATFHSPIPSGVRVAQSVQRLATGWTVRGSNSGGGRDFPHLSRPALGPTQPPVQQVQGLCWG